MARGGAQQSFSDGMREFMGSVTFSPDGKRIAVNREGGTARVIDAQTGGVVLELKGRPLRFSQVRISTGVLTVAFSPDGTRIVTGGTTGGDRVAAVSVWDARIVVRSENERLTRARARLFSVLGPSLRS
jgi:WD40 repeat protein